MGEGKGAVEEAVSLVEDLDAAICVVWARPVPRNGVCAVERIEEGAPSRVACVHDEPRIVHWAHELGPGDGGDLGVHVLGRHGNGFGRAGDGEVADVLEERFVTSGVVGLAAVHAVVRINVALQLVAALKLLAVPRREVVDDGGEALPEDARIYVGAGHDDVVHHILEVLVHADARYRNRLSCRGLRCNVRWAQDRPRSRGSVGAEGAQRRVEGAAHSTDDARRA
mmetsp:Transcript_22798/g.61811  ORF Transcript_22798/g.61811 Transcript_22798/m.61811 type:complete len:225 (+) Transcript_22798:2637-3311(+)